MLSKLLKNAQFFHLKMIHDYPKGMQNRFKDTGDKWVQTFKHPHVKTYYQFFLNQQTHQYDITLIKTQKEESQIQKIKHSHRPGLAAMADYFSIFQEKRPDDYELSRDVSDMTVAKFISEGREDFSHLHKLVSTGLLFIVAHIVLYFIFFHNKQLPKNERVKVLNAQILETYQFQKEQADIKHIIQRIKIVNDQYQKQLTQSKQLK